MALVVEDGSGLPDAEAFVSVAEADAYHAARGNTIWAPLLEAEKEQALRRAADFMRQTYAGRWKGCRVKATQALDWPRYGVEYDGFELLSDEIPVALAQANAFLAFKGAGGDLAPDLQPQAIRKTVGPITVEYAPGARQTVRYQAIDAMLAPLLAGSGSMLRVVRA